MPNREPIPEQGFKTKTEKPKLRLVKTNEGETLIDQARQIEAWRDEEVKEKQHVKEVRYKISGNEINRAWSTVAKAESLFLSDNVSESSLDQLENDLRNGLDMAETAQMELRGTPDSTSKDRTMKQVRELIAKLESLLEIAGLDPENAKREFLRSKMAMAEKVNWQQLNRRQTELKRELSALNRQVDALEEKIEKSGAYGQGVSADELSSPATGFMSRLKTGLIDTWRKATGQEAMLSDLKKLHARQNTLAQELHYSEETVPSAETEEQAEARRKKLKKYRRDKKAATEAYGGEKAKTSEELEQEITGEKIEAETEEETSGIRKRLKFLTPDKKKTGKEVEFEKQIRPPEKLMREHARAEKKLGLMTIDAAKTLVPEARDLWNLASKNLEKYPLTALKMHDQKQFGVSDIENHPATIYVYTIARYKQALREVDNELADEYLAQINTLNKELHLENNALVKSALARKPEIKDVLRGTKQRRAAVNRQTARWKF